MGSQVTVVDYGIGNIHSVLKALRHQGADVTLSASPEAVRAAERLVLPGVGAFGDGMAALEARALVGAIKDFVRGGRPFLGICLGMQLLLSESEEFGWHQGLDLIPGRVVQMQRRDGFKVPQIGWNGIAPRPGGTWADSILQPLPTGTQVYFVHSFNAEPSQEEHRLADADYGGVRVTAAIRRDNVVGCQFHPEKSGPAGLRVIAEFLN